MENIEDKIISICELLDNQDELNKKIKVFSKEIESEKIDDLISICERKIIKPNRIKFPIELYRERRVSNWDGLCHYVIFNVIYEHKERAVSYLIKNLNNKEELISAGSLTKLCKIATEGIQQEFILKSIYNLMDELQDIPLKMLIQGLFPIKQNEIVDKIYDKIIKESIKTENSSHDIVHIYRSINFWTKSNLEKPKKYLPFLKEISLPYTFSYGKLFENWKEKQCCF